MNMDDNIINVVDALGDSVIIKLYIVNKKIYNAVTKYFTDKLTNRHKQCMRAGDQIDLRTFCNHFIRRLALGLIYDDTDYRIKNLAYDYCHGCGLFGLQSLDRLDYKICEPGCVVTCCDRSNIIRQLYEYDTDTNIKLPCGCYLTTRQFSFSFSTVCGCGEEIISTTTKCKNCGKIPLRQEPTPILIQCDEFYF